MKIISHYSNKNKPLILKPLVNKIKKRNIAAFDLETKGLGGKIEIGGFYDGINYYEFYSENEFLDLICKQKYSGYYIYAHNGGKYDFLYLLEYFKNEVEIIDINGRILSLKIKLSNNKFIYLVDSFYTLEYSLDKLITAFEINEFRKIKINFDNVNKNDELVRLHLKNDCFALYYIIDKFQEMVNNLGGNLKMTSASISMDIFKRQYLDCEIPTYFRYEDQIRQAYFGGRTEVFKKKLDHGYYYDINSLYPSQMNGNYYPVGNPNFISNYNYDVNDIGFVNIETKIKMNIPFLPVKGDYLIFPNGNIKGWFSTVYLKKLKKLNIPFKCNEALLFDKSKIFNSFVINLYKLRMKNKNTVLELIVKLMLNSLYGKFAQNTTKKIYVINPSEIKKDYYLYSPKFNIFYYEKKIKYNYILPALSAFVTSYAQLELYKYLDTNTWYCDTDSVITTNEITTSNKLGDMKLEHEIFNGFFITQKMYCFKNEKNKIIKKAKGFTKDMLKNLSINDYKRAVLEQDYLPFVSRKKSIFGWKESIVRSKEHLVNYDEKIRSLNTVDTKRIFLDINKSIPFTI